MLSSKAVCLFAAWASAKNVMADPMAAPAKVTATNVAHTLFCLSQCLLPAQHLTTASRADVNTTCPGTTVLNWTDMPTDF